MKLSIATTKRLLDLRTKLNSISEISWQFSILNKKYPIDQLDEQSANELIETYRQLIADITNLKSENEHEIPST